MAYRRNSNSRRDSADEWHTDVTNDPQDKKEVKNKSFLSRLIYALVFCLVALSFVKLIPIFRINGIIKYNYAADQAICQGWKNISFQENGECYFIEGGYLLARQKFRDLATELGAEQYTKVIVEKGSTISKNDINLPSDIELTMDIAIFRGNDERVIWHQSGTHGAEGYAGSAIQLAAMDQLFRTYARISESDLNTYIEHPTVVFVHAVNPYGFYTGRRVNEENIDINRNHLTDEEFENALNRDINTGFYQDLSDILNPQSFPTKFLYLNDLWSISNTGAALLKHGFLKLKTAIVSGNYYKKDGVGFGGNKRSRSVESLIELAIELNIDFLNMETVKSAVFIDVHTGLGPSGADTFLLSDNLDKEEINKIYPFEGKDIGGMKEFTKWGGSDVKKEKGKDETVNENSASAGYDFTIGTSHNLCHKWLFPHLKEEKDKESGEGGDLLCLTQEYGTVPASLVGINMINENIAHFHYPSSVKINQLYKQRYRNCFFVEERKWKRNVVRRGVKIILQSMDFLNKSNKLNIPSSSSSSSSITRGIEVLNSMTMEERRENLMHICTSKEWSLRVSAVFPFYSIDSIDEFMKNVWWSLSETDWKEAFAGHPKIGDVEGLKKKFADKKNAPAWEGDEQSGTREASDEVINELAIYNDLYEKRYGFIFLVCATNQTALDMLNILKSRMSNTIENELIIAADEQRKITSLRLVKLLNELSERE